MKGEEFQDSNFIESCLTCLKSNWAEIRGNAALVIGILSHYNKKSHVHNLDVSNKISVLLRDDNIDVRIKASKALSYIFGDI